MLCLQCVSAVSQIGLQWIIAVSLPSRSSCTALPDGTPLCTCNRGYTGPLCDQCDEGFHGNPPAVPCLSCECNGNIDPSVPGSCNASTGECLICTNNATGRQCEQCMEGFYGDATAQQCQSECVDDVVEAHCNGVYI